MKFYFIFFLTISLTACATHKGHNRDQAQVYKLFQKIHKNAYTSKEDKNRLPSSLVMKNLVHHCPEITGSYQCSSEDSMRPPSTYAPSISHIKTEMVNGMVSYVWKNSAQESGRFIPNGKVRYLTEDDSDYSHEMAFCRDKKVIIIGATFNEHNQSLWSSSVSKTKNDNLLIQYFSGDTETDDSHHSPEQTNYSFSTLCVKE